MINNGKGVGRLKSLPGIAGDADSGAHQEGANDSAGASQSIPFEAEKAKLRNRGTGDGLQRVQPMNISEFADQAGRIVMLGAELLERRMQAALVGQQTLDKAVEAIMADDDISIKEKTAATKAIANLVLPDIREISSVISTVFEKRALVKGEPAIAMHDNWLRDIGTQQIKAMLQELEKQNCKEDE